MFSRKSLAAVAAAASLAFGGVALANTPATGSDQLTLNPVLLAAEGDAPLMGWLKKVGVGQPLADAGFNIYGHIAGSYLYNASAPDSGPAGRVFDAESNEDVLNAIRLVITRGIDASKGFDIGGTIEMNFGRDMRFIHSNGIMDAGEDTAVQFDLTQAYLEFGFPVGDKPLTFKAGKFATLLGWEVIDQTANTFYTHSFSFGYAISFTHTGVLASYPILDNLSVTAGITRGWEQSTDDANDSIDLLGQVKWGAADNLTLYFNCSVGPQQADNNHDYRWLINVIAEYTGVENWKFVADTVFAWESDAGIAGDDATWYGIVLYGVYDMNQYLSLAGRIEWFSDPDGARGFDTDVFGFTAGATFTPFPEENVASRIKIRPEVRLDLASDDVFNGDDSQITFAIDAFFNY